MGIWDFINSGKETLKGYTPDPVKKVYNTTYYYSVVAVRKIDDVIRVNGIQKLDQYIPDDEGRAKIVSFSTKFIKNASVFAVKEAANSGKAVTKIYFDTVREMETKCQKKQDESSLRLLDGAEMLESRELKLGSENRVEVDSFAYQTPEYVLRVFMMGTRYLDNLLVTVNWEKLNLHIKVE
ncbi:uncharacterized protein LOC107773312 [Nicotiana tabacum]|uniref:Uncharacterized protein LOC107773312 n=1 Tax=Nicotiana tabacum TaxID=4097 RepID=A0AC58RVS3_TOBAC